MPDTVTLLTKFKPHGAAHNAIDGNNVSKTIVNSISEKKKKREFQCHVNKIGSTLRVLEKKKKSLKKRKNKTNLKE